MFEILVFFRDGEFVKGVVYGTDEYSNELIEMEFHRQDGYSFEKLLNLYSPNDFEYSFIEA